MTTEGKVWDLLVNRGTTQVGRWPEAWTLNPREGTSRADSEPLSPQNEELTEAPCRRGQLLWPPASLHPALPTRVSFPACSFFLSPLAALGSLPSGLLRGAWGAAVGLGAVVVLREPPGALAEGDT